MKGEGGMCLMPEEFKSFPAKVYALTHVTRFRRVRDVCVQEGGGMPGVEVGQGVWGD